MKLRAEIIEDVPFDSHIIIVRFEKDKLRQEFEIYCTFNAYRLKLRKYETYDLKIKYKSNVITDPVSGNKSYDTFLSCDAAQPVHEVGRK